jgi:hypothetical protein
MVSLYAMLRPKTASNDEDEYNAYDDASYDEDKPTILESIYALFGYEQDYDGEIVNIHSSKPNHSIFSYFWPNNTTNKKQSDDLDNDYNCDW